jgi:phenylalanyl-tRNA synthetase beta chain
MNLLTSWIRSFLPELAVDDVALAEALTLRGIAVEGIHSSGDGGSLFEMDITTNRVDAMNHYGVAREVAAIYSVALKPLVDVIREIDEPHSSAATHAVTHAATESAIHAATSAAAHGAGSQAGAEGGYPVRIEAEDLCGHFTARVIRGITVKAATGEMAARFSALGQKPISAPVDATNFGWLAMGQPTHCFDLDKLEGAIVVRRARAGEKLQLLDGTEKTLVVEDLVVADERKALALAGVMGGWDSRVTDETKNVLVEAAWFLPAAVRASSRRHGLHTDASHRFERGADFNAAPVANDLVTRLIVAQCGGEVAGRRTQVIVPALAAQTAERAPITLRLKQVQRLLGETIDAQGITAALVERYLMALGCTLRPAGLEAWTVTLPSWRLDLEREIDLIEEVARVYGYNGFANTLPRAAKAVEELPHARQAAAIRTTLRGLGWSEALSSTFASEAECEAFGAANGVVALGNPMSDVAGSLRATLLPNMAVALAENLHRDAREVRIFELGTVFSGSAAQVDEAQALVLGATAATPGTSLYGSKDALFYEVKGAVEAFLERFAGTLTFDAGALPATLPPWIEPGRGARVLLGGKAVGVLGELNAAEMQRRKLRQTCVLAELDAEALLHTALRTPAAKELSRFQAVERDFSFVFADAVTWQGVDSALQGLNIAEMTSVAPGEIFRDAKGKAVAAGQYSLLLQCVFQAIDRTLTEDELTAWSGEIVRALTELGGVQRASST